MTKGNPFLREFPSSSKKGIGIMVPKEFLGNEEGKEFPKGIPSSELREPKKGTRNLGQLGCHLLLLCGSVVNLLLCTACERR
jgi:hypothetical protein